MRLLYFAWVKEKTGIAAEEVELPADVATIGDVMTWLKARGPEFANAFERSEVIRAAIDQSHVRHDAKIGGAREIAFFPPVTGG
ncbi:MAG TPA: molybdopterin converting factor subunit 1 [Rhizobiales bacterium]|jgi:sulfur-carrier protein|nr:molybdopterin converting factor subunit 1 [Hyphomicrobiales bacterium]